MTPNQHGKYATIFGGRGFIGGHIVNRLAQAGYTIRVVTRYPSAAYALRTCGLVGQIVPVSCDITNADDICKTIRNSDVVINCIGTLFDKKGSFQKLHHEFPAALAKACAAENVTRFVHISALGCDLDKSNYAKSKRAGEDAVRANFPVATILRPSVVFGPEDKFFNKFAKMSALLPFLPLIGGGHTRFQPVYVGDVADAAVKAAERPDVGAQTPLGKTYELAGPETMDFKDIYRLIARYTGIKRPGLNLPLPLARFQAGLFSLLPNPPVTNDQITSLQTDNVAGSILPGLNELGIQPTFAASILPAYLERYQRGGKFAERKRA